MVPLLVLPWDTETRVDDVDFFAARREEKDFVVRPALHQTLPEHGLEVLPCPVRGVVRPLAAARVQVPRYRGKEEHRSPLQKTEDWEAVSEVHVVESFLACKHKLPFNVELAVTVAPGWKI